MELEVQTLSGPLMEGLSVAFILTDTHHISLMIACLLMNTPEFLYDLSNSPSKSKPLVLCPPPTHLEGKQMIPS